MTGEPLMPAFHTSPVNRIVETLSGALTALAIDASPLDLERWGFAIHASLASRTREFHNHQHVHNLVDEADPLETLAALYHDLVYVQVDLEIPGRPGKLLARYLGRDGGGWRILPAAGEEAITREVLGVFGFSVGQTLSPFAGLNELASTLVAIKELEPVLRTEWRLAIACCIEATIPFRSGSAAALEARLLAMGRSPEEIRELVRRAVRMANRDVDNFAEPDPARFLDTTWKLLPETNPSLKTPSLYSVSEYRVALQTMEGFLSALAPERVFQAWGGEPDAEIHQARVQAARRNLALASRYLAAKLYSIALLEALCLETGGDMPLDYLMGGLPSPGGLPMRRLEQFLPEPTGAFLGDPILQRLLEGGRASPSSFDIPSSPVAAFLVRQLGEVRLRAGLEQARRLFRKECSARQFLEGEPRQLVLALAHAAQQLASTRAAGLKRLTEELG